MSFFGLFGKKKKEKISFPYNYLKIVWTESAIHQGIKDDFNKEIQIIKGDEIVEVRPYTKEELNAILEVHNIPFIDMTKLDTDDFKFEELDFLDGTYSEVRV